MIERRGIKGLEGREPVGVVLSIGRKDPQRGFPTDKDRFYLVQPRETSIDGKGVRPAHPMFTVFNQAAPEHRRVIRGNIVHANERDCFEWHLKAQVLDRKGHPNRRPCCVGDGARATRWMGGAPDNFAEIDCPHDLCPYRQKTPPDCKPWMRMLFQLNWKEGSPMPAMLCKFTSAAWNTTANFRGFFDSIHTAAAQLGIRDYTLFGYPFVLTLTEQTKPSANSRFPVVTITPSVNPVEFFQMQAQMRQQLAEAPAFMALPDPEQQASYTLYEDVRGVSRGEAEFPTAHEEIAQPDPPQAQTQALCDGSGFIPTADGFAEDCPGCQACTRS